MPYSNDRNEPNREKHGAVAAGGIIILGIFLPYVTALAGYPIINIPWSLIFGIIPFVLYDVVGSIVGTNSHQLRIAGLLISPIAISYLIFISWRRLEAVPRKAWLWAYAILALIDLPASIVIDQLGMLPFYQKYAAF